LNRIKNLKFTKLYTEGPIGILTLNRPEKLNALNTRVYEELITSLETIEANDQIRIVILTGAGNRAFAAGADISQMVDQDGIEGRHMSRLTHRAADLLEDMRQVTIAAVNGYALGGGCELALACDIRVASDNARFALPEVGLGIIPAGGGTQRLSRLVGVGRAKELIFTGDHVNAWEAYRIGLVNHVVSQENLMDYCRVMAEKIASKSGYAVTLAKSCINTSMEADLSTGAAREEDLFGLLFTTKDKKEGMTAFLERRKPHFTDF